MYTIGYGGTGTGKTYFVRQFLKLYQDLDQNQDNKNLVEHDRRSMAKHVQRPIIIVCKGDRDWINPETGEPYSEFNMCDIIMITSKNMHMF